MVNAEIGNLRTKLQAYEKFIGFEKESEQLHNSIEKLEAQKQSLLSRKKELTSKDSSNRLRYQQEIAELLSKKESLEVSVFTKAEFDAEIVNVEFRQNKCILYLRRLKTKKGTENG